jgi:hypothetical protein
MSLTEILKNRTNVSFFRNDRIPEKKLIQEILSQAHELTPHKNNFWHYEIEVYGPEHDEEKKYAALATVCSEAMYKYRDTEATPADFEELKKIYEVWLDSHNDEKTKKEFNEIKSKLNKIHFNNQVRAPYLLVYTKKEQLLTQSQKDSDYYRNGKLNALFKVKEPNSMWLIQAGMHSIITSALAVEKGLDASFCKCYFYNTNIHSNILRKASTGNNNIAFLLGLGFKDEVKYQYKSHVPKANLDEIVKWV